jgi:RNA polymerase sigma-70 factor (ECF subfamily)
MARTLDDRAENSHGFAAETRVEEFVRLLTGNERHLKSYILSLVPNLADAEQIAQETSLRLWEQFGQYDPCEGEFSAWARSIAHYQVLTFRKKLGRERLVFSSELVELLAERAAARGVELGSRQEALIDCVQKLPDHARELIRLYYVLGMKLREAAEALGRSAAATEKAIVRIRHVLRNCINSSLQSDRLQGGGDP